VRLDLECDRRPVAEVEYARAGRHRVAARVTDVLGNDGFAVVDVTTT